MHAIASQKVQGVSSEPPTKPRPHASLQKATASKGSAVSSASLHTSQPREEKTAAAPPAPRTEAASPSPPSAVKESPENASSENASSEKASSESGSSGEAFGAGVASLQGRRDVALRVQLSQQQRLEEQLKDRKTSLSPLEPQKGSLVAETQKILKKTSQASTNALLKQQREEAKRQKLAAALGKAASPPKADKQKILQKMMELHSSVADIVNQVRFTNPKASP